MSRNVMVVGDLHGEWGELNTLINKRSPDIILQVGDFGWWSHFHGKKGLGRKGRIFDQFGIKPQDTKIFWIAGNHENWDDLNCITDDTPYEIQDNVTYCPFGTVIEIDGTNILMCGGAESTDKDGRTEGIDWWRSEIITQEEMDRLPDCRIDVVISHTIPRFFFESASWTWYHERYNDSSTYALQLIFTKYKPKKWYSGHFHHFHQQTINDCEWTSLSYPRSLDQWWINFNA